MILSSCGILRIKLNEEINVKQLAQCLTNTQRVVEVVVVLVGGRHMALNPFCFLPSCLLAQN